MIFAAFLGAVIALLPILVWELWWRPVRYRQLIARTLRVEITFARDRVVAVQKWMAKTPGHPIPTDFKIATFAWDSVAENVAELDERVMKAVYRTYNDFHDLNGLAARFAMMDEAQRKLPRDDEFEQLRFDAICENIQHHFGRRAPSTVELANVSIEELGRVIRESGLHRRLAERWRRSRPARFFQRGRSKKG